jgi:hypothetical protein
MHDFVEFKLPGFLLVVYYAAMLVLGDAHRDRLRKITSIFCSENDILAS